MAFQIVSRRPCAFQRALKVEELSLQRTGNAGVLADALELVGIKERYIALADPETLRVGVRPARPEDGENVFSVTTQRNKKGADTRRRALNLRAAILELKLDPQAVAGRYELQTVDDVLFVVLTSPTVQDRARRGARETEADRQRGSKKSAAAPLRTGTGGEKMRTS